MKDTIPVVSRLIGWDKRTPIRPANKAGTNPWTIRIFGVSVLGRWIYIEAGLTGVAGLFLLAKLLDKHRIGDGLSWVGRASLAVFLLSAFAQVYGA